MRQHGEGLGAEYECAFVKDCGYRKRQEGGWCEGFARGQVARHETICRRHTVAERRAFREARTAWASHPWATARRVCRG